MAALQAAVPADFQVFAAEGFDPQSYANAVINNEPYKPQASSSGSRVNGATPAAVSSSTGITITGGDVSAALAKLNVGIEDLNRQLRAEVTAHHPALLNKAASLSSLEEALRSVRKGLGEVENSVARLQKKIAEPYEVLEGALGRLEKLQRAAELCRRVARFASLARRLKGHMEQFERTDVDDANASSAGAEKQSLSSTRQERRERALAEAALTLAELDSVLALDDQAPPPADGSTNSALGGARRVPSMRDLRAIQTHLAAVNGARQVVEEEMESMIGQGLVRLDQALLASSLQTAYNLSVLPSLVASLITDLTEAVTGRIRVAFDVSAIAREVSQKDPSATSAFVYKSRARTEPTNVTLPQWTSALWSRLEALIDDMTGCCVKVYTLEKVLEWKKDAVTGVPFLDEAMQGELKERPRVVFWTTLAQVFEQQARQASGSSTFVQQSLTVSYPRLLRLFHDFFARIAVHTSTVYNSTSQSPETVLLLRAVAPFEAMYISRSAQRMNDAIQSAMARCTAPGQGANEGQTLARVLGNELDAARFDPLLLGSVAKKVKEAGTSFVSRVEVASPSDYSSRSMLGPVATPAQLQNAEYASAVSYLSSRLSRALSEFPESVKSTVLPAIETADVRSQAITNSLGTAMRREISAILGRMHRLDFSRTDTSNHGTSGYINDLTSKLAFIREELLMRYRLADGKLQPWVLNIARHLLRSFVLHASMVAPLGEAGKLRLTADMAELEFALSNLSSLAGVASGTQLSALIGEEWRALRGFRQLLFMEKDVLAKPPPPGGQASPVDEVPTLVVLHHIAVRSRADVQDGQEGLKMPHEANGWTHAEYMKWLEEHMADSDRLKLFEGALGEATGDWAVLARRIIDDAKLHEE